MELRFTEHARRLMAAEGVHRMEVEVVLTDPVDVEVAEVAVRYHGIVADRVIEVFILRDSDPPLVITVSARQRR